MTLLKLLYRKNTAVCVGITVKHLPVFKMLFNFRSWHYTNKVVYSVTYLETRKPPTESSLNLLTHSNFSPQEDLISRLTGRPTSPVTQSSRLRVGRELLQPIGVQKRSAF